MVAGKLETVDQFKPITMPLGDGSVLVRFSSRLDDSANRAASIFSRVLRERQIDGIEEIVPNLASVLIRYDARRITYRRLIGELALVVPPSSDNMPEARNHMVKTWFGGEHGPDLGHVAELVGMSERAFVSAHCASALRVLATGFAPGFVYCGFHEKPLEVPRRAQIRQQVPPGSILFAAGQTAITSTPIPTGWHVIGHTDLRNFDPEIFPPTRLSAGDTVTFEPVV